MLFRLCPNSFGCMSFWVGRAKSVLIASDQFRQFTTNRSRWILSFWPKCFHSSDFFVATHIPCGVFTENYPAIRWLEFVALANVFVQLYLVQHVAARLIKFVCNRLQLIQYTLWTTSTEFPLNIISRTCMRAYVYESHKQTAAGKINIRIWCEINNKNVSIRRDIVSESN